MLLMALSPTPALGTITQVLAVKCDCGVHFAWPSHVSTAECPGCGRQELWHKVEPRPETGPWSAPVMERPMCMACGLLCDVECILPNGELEAWIVCMKCFEADAEGDEG